MQKFLILRNHKNISKSTNDENININSLGDSSTNIYYF